MHELLCPHMKQHWLTSQVVLGIWHSPDNRHRILIAFLALLLITAELLAGHQGQVEQAAVQLTRELLPVVKTLRLPPNTMGKVIQQRITDD